MRIYFGVARTLSSVALTSGSVAVLSVAALAGTPGVMNYQAVQNAKCNRVIGSNVGIRPAPRVGCSAYVINHAGGADALAPVNAYNSVPYGHLKTFAYKNTPNVNVMRIHSRAPLAGLNDVPTGFTDGCAPASTGYCRSKGAALPTLAAPVPRPIYAPAPLSIVRAPVAPVVPHIAPRVTPMYKMRPPVPCPAVRPPIVRPMPRYNPANISPCQFARPALRTYAPKPIVVNRGYNPAQRRIVVQKKMTPNVSMPVPQGGNILGYVPAGARTYQPPGGGRYWEKTSGPTRVEGLAATQVLCRRAAPQPVPVAVNVVRPVIGVPYAVPTPFAVPQPSTCGGAPTLAPRPGYVPSYNMPGYNMPVLAGGRWTM